MCPSDLWNAIDYKNAQRYDFSMGTTAAMHHSTAINIACTGVKAMCSSSRIQAHIHVPDTAKKIGWIMRDPGVVKNVVLEKE